METSAYIFPDKFIILVIGFCLVSNIENATDKILNGMGGPAQLSELCSCWFNRKLSCNRKVVSQHKIFSISVDAKAQIWKFQSSALNPETKETKNLDHFCMMQLYF